MARTSRFVSYSLTSSCTQLTMSPVVEQYRLLEQMIEVIKVIDDRTGKPICNPDVCPTMSASG